MQAVGIDYPPVRVVTCVGNDFSASPGALSRKVQVIDVDDGRV